MKSFRLTKFGCYVGIFIQAITCNFTAVIFVPLMLQYNLSFVDLGTLVGINFIAQVSVDLIFSGVIDKYGYKKLALPAVACAFIGLCFFALSPNIFGENVKIGFVLSTVIFAAAAGLLDVMISPIVNAIPSESKGASMSLMHSFYAWGHLVTVAVTTLFMLVFGQENWQIIVLLWAIMPLCNFFVFLFSTFPDVSPHTSKENKKSIMSSPFFIIALFAIFFGAATEIIAAQWSSSFLEKALGFDKATGDLIGVCGFAFMMGIGRVLFGIFGKKIDFAKMLVICSILGIFCYLTVAISPSNTVNIIAMALTGIAASVLWPGTLVVSAEKFPLAGAWMFAFLAASGDIGAAFGPWLTGFIIDFAGDSMPIKIISDIYSVGKTEAAMRLAMIVAAIFPLFALICHSLLVKKRDNPPKK